MITLDVLNHDPGITHAFFTRRGGVSSGLFASLNCGFGSGDAAERVARNRAVATAQLGLSAERLVTCYQVHSNRAVSVDEPWSHDAAPRADGLVTRMPGIALGILTADCAPILFEDAAAGIIGAAHGGWRGALGGIVEATLERMETLGAKRARIRAGVGPCIAQTSYEVGPEFLQRFLSHDPSNAAYFAPALRGNHFMFDLPGYIESRLARAGIVNIARTAHDTVAEDLDFFSYRRSCLRGEKVYGRALSAIALRD
jgi:purine-nucleoside/S-methyl-5'-thioadenosine phosphorylase / adenosine deaminase